VKRCASGHVYDRAGWQCPKCGDEPATLDSYLSFAPALARKNEGFPAESFPQLAKLEEGHFWFEARNRLLLWVLERYFPNPANFLEAGCGTGFVLAAICKRFPQARVSGSEIYIDGLAFASRRVPSATLFQMDARSMPFESEFDVIGAFDVLEHIEEDEAVLREMHRALRPGGGLVLTVPQHPFLWSAVDDYSHHKRRYTRAELVRKLRASGFEILMATSFVSVLLPVMFVSRWRRRGAPAFDPGAEFRLNRAVNWGLAKALGCERRLIQSGISLPFGGSLLIAARRV
jgi:SAM-dependent methyltransferase